MKTEFIATLVGIFVILLSSIAFSQSTSSINFSPKSSSNCPPLSFDNLLLEIPDTCTNTAVLKLSGFDEISFTKIQLNDNAQSARELVPADIDGDGIQDLVGVSQLDNTLRWYKNSGGESPMFTEIIISDQEEKVRAIKAIDFDQDGDIDILTASATAGALNWFENNGTVAPQFTKQLLYEDVASTRSIDVADFDGDGMQEILVALFDQDELILLNNTGTIAAPTYEKQVIDATLDGARSASFADLDGNGQLDILAAGWHSNELVWYKVNDVAILDYERIAITVDVEQPSSVIAVDLDLDNDLDIVATISLEQALIWYENTTGNFSDLTKHTIASLDRDLSDIAHASVVDLDLDGDLDILTASFTSGDIHYFEQTADKLSFNKYNVSSDIINFPSNIHGAHRVFPVQLNDDAYPDIAVAAVTDNTFATFIQMPNIIQPATLNYLVEQNSYETPLFLDAKGDAVTDILGLSDGAHTLELQHITDGTGCQQDLTESASFYLYNEDVEITVSYNGIEIPSGDLRADIPSGTDFGYVETEKDVVFTLTNEGTMPLELLGTAPFQSSNEANFTIIPPTETSLNPDESTTFTIRFTPDCQLVSNALISILNTDCDENIYQFSVRGRGGFLPLETEITPSCAGENNGEIVLMTSENYNYAWSTGAQSKDINGLGAGLYRVTITDPITSCTQVQKVVLRNASQPDLRETTLSISDICDDEEVKVVLSRLPKMEFSKLPTTEFNSSAVDFSNSGNALGIADLDNDGDDDIIAEDPEGILKWYVNEEGSFNTEIVISTNFYFISDIVIGDLNHDDWLDIAYFDEELIVYQNNGNATFTKQIIPNSDQQICDLQILDYDNDEKKDLVTVEYEQIKAYTWMNNEFQSVVLKKYDTVLYNINGGVDKTKLKYGDVDNDGDMDFLLGNAASRNIELLENIGLGNFGDPQTVIQNAYYSFQLADMNQDDDLDILIADNAGVRWYESDGNYNFVTEHQINSNIQGFDLQIFDYEEDGDIDFIYAELDDNFDYYIAFYENQGLNQYKASFVSPDLITARNRYLFNYAVGYFNDDQTIDIATRGEVDISREQLFLLESKEALSTSTVLAYQLNGGVLQEADLLLNADTIGIATLPAVASGVHVFNSLEIIEGNCNHALNRSTDFYSNTEQTSLSISDEDYDFGQIRGDDSQTKVYTISNDGTSDLLIKEDIISSDPIHFQIKQPIPRTLAPNTSTEFSITFIPNCIAVASSEIILKTNDCESAELIFTVTGASALPEVNAVFTPSCVNAATGQINLNVTSQINESNFTYNWTNENNQTVANTKDLGPVTAGDYYLELTENATGCVLNFDYTIAESPEPDLSQVSIDAPSICSDELLTATFNALPSREFILHEDDDYIYDYAQPNFRYIDFDNDGDKDAISFVDNQINWFANEGDTWSEAQLISSLNPFVNRIRLVDFDSDGDLDLVGVSQKRPENRYYIEWFENIDHQQFILRNTNHELSEDLDSYTLLVDDFDNDGDEDVLFTQSNTIELAILENDGEENFTRVVVLEDIEDDYIIRFFSSGLADFDNDGLTEVLVTNRGRDGLLLLKNNGALNFTITQINNDIYDISALEIVDYDNDGRLEIVISSIAYVYGLDFESGTWHTKTLNPNNSLGFYLFLQYADLDQNGLIDIIAYEPNGSTYILSNEGDHKFSIRELFFGDYFHFTLDDFDEDGDLDFVLDFDKNSKTINWMENNVPSTIPYDVYWNLDNQAQTPINIQSPDVTGNISVDIPNVIAGVHNINLSHLTDNNNCTFSLDETIDFEIYNEAAALQLVYNKTVISNEENDYRSRIPVIQSVVGETIDIIFTIENTGTVPLELTGNPIFTLDDNEEYFTVIQPNTSEISPGMAMNIVIQYTGDCVSEYRETTVSFSTNSCTDKLFTFDIGVFTTSPFLLADIQNTCSATGNGSIHVFSHGTPIPTATHYEYQWVNSSGIEVGNTAQIDNLEADVYTVSVTEMNTGCMLTENFEVKEEVIPSSEDLTITVKDACFGEEPILTIEGLGTSSFTYKKTLDLYANIQTTVSILADIDRDGHLDLVTNRRSRDGVYWSRNDGTGLFETPQLLLDVERGISGIKCADVDGDGLEDLLVCDSYNLYFYKKMAQGLQYVKSTLQENSSDTTFDCDHLFVEDFNLDGVKEILYVNGRGTSTAFRIYNNRGNNSFDVTYFYNDFGIHGIEIVDFDKDGFLDIVTTGFNDFNESLLWYKNDGAGNFQSFSFSVIAGTGESLKTYDMDNDGDLDIIVGNNYSNQMYWYEHTGDFQFIQYQISTDNTYITSVVIEDFDNDGDPDIVGLGAENFLYYENQGDGTFITESFDTGEFLVFSRISAANLDEDDAKEILVVYEHDFYIIEIENVIGVPLSFDYAIDGGTPKPISFAEVSYSGKVNIPLEDLTTGEHSFVANNFNFGKCSAPLLTLNNNFDYQSSPAYTEEIEHICGIGNNTGRISLTPEDDYTYLYLWSNNSVASNLTNLPAGDYQVTITDGNCTEENAFSVNEFSNPNLDHILIEGSSPYCSTSSINLRITNVREEDFQGGVEIDYLLNDELYHLSINRPQVGTVIYLSIPNELIQVGLNEFEIVRMANTQGCITNYTAMPFTFEVSEGTGNIAVEVDSREIRHNTSSGNFYPQLNNPSTEEYNSVAEFKIKNIGEMPLEIDRDLSFIISNPDAFQISVEEGTTVAPGAFLTCTVMFIAEVPDTYYNTFSIFNSSCTTPEFVVKMKGIVEPQPTVALAIQALDFQARKQKEKEAVDLNWSIQSDENYTTYLQWSPDALNWSNIHYNLGEAGMKEQQFIHESPVKGVNYYQLVLTTEIGEILDSPIRAVWIEETKSENNFVLYPNPTSDLIQITCKEEDSKDMKVKVSVFNYLGQLVQTTDMTITKSLDLSQLATGTYQVVLQKGEKRQVEKVVLLR